MNSVPLPQINSPPSSRMNSTSSPRMHSAPSPLFELSSPSSQMMSLDPLSPDKTPHIIKKRLPTRLSLANLDSPQVVHGLTSSSLIYDKMLPVSSLSLKPGPLFFSPMDSPTDSPIDSEFTDMGARPFYIYDGMKSTVKFTRDNSFMNDVFISYRHSTLPNTDSTEFTRSVYEYLTSHQVHCWYDNNLTIGRKWDSALFNNLLNCNCMILIISLETLQIWNESQPSIFASFFGEVLPSSLSNLDFVLIEWIMALFLQVLYPKNFKIIPIFLGKILLSLQRNDFILTDLPLNSYFKSISIIPFKKELLSFFKKIILPQFNKPESEDFLINLFIKHLTKYNTIGDVFNTISRLQAIRIPEIDKPRSEEEQLSLIYNKYIEFSGEPTQVRKQRILSDIENRLKDCEMQKNALTAEVHVLNNLYEQLSKKHIILKDENQMLTDNLYQSTDKRGGQSNNIRRDGQSNNIRRDGQSNNIRRGGQSNNIRRGDQSNNSRRGGQSNNNRRGGQSNKQYGK